MANPKHTFRRWTPDSAFRRRRRRRIPMYCGSESALEGWSKQLKNVGSTALFFSSSDELLFSIVSSAMLRSFRRILHQKSLIQSVPANPTVKAWGGRWHRPRYMIGGTTGFDVRSGYGDLGAQKFRATGEFRWDSVLCLDMRYSVVRWLGRFEWRAVQSFTVLSVPVLSFLISQNHFHFSRIY